MGSDQIRLTGLQATGYHGVFDFEKDEPQPFRVDAELTLDLSAAGRSDDLKQTVSYADLADMIESIVTGESFDLIEALGETIARAVLTSNERIEAATVTVHKPKAPLTQDFDDVAVTIRRTRGDLDPVKLTMGTGTIPRIIHQAELVEEDAPVTPASSPLTNTPEAEPADPAHTYATPTSQLGPYGRINLAEMSAENDAETQPATHLRDPDLPAAFPVRAVLALGSNLGDSRATLTSAVTALQGNDDVVILSASPLARTKPVGGPGGQRDYLNQVVEIETRLSPHALLDVAQQIEANHNRARGAENGEVRWGSRTLDVDIVTYAGAVISSSRLQIPHPSAGERAFVLLPWSWMDPVALLGGRPVRELALDAPDYEEVRMLEDDVGIAAGEPSP